MKPFHINNFMFEPIGYIIIAFEEVIHWGL